jgi:hypothetical protein
VVFSAIVVVDGSAEVGEGCEASLASGAEVVMGLLDADETEPLIAVESVPHEVIRNKIEMQTKRGPKMFPIEWLR